MTWVPSELSEDVDLVPGWVNPLVLASSRLFPTLLDGLTLLNESPPLIYGCKSILGVRPLLPFCPSTPSLTVNVTGSFPGVVNVTIVLCPSSPRWVVTVGVCPFRPAAPVSPLAPSWTNTVVGWEPSWLSIVTSTPLCPSSLRTAVTVGDLPSIPSLITARGLSGVNGWPGCIGSSW